MGKLEPIVVDEEVSDLVHRFASKLVRQRCPGAVDPCDIAQEILMNMYRKPLMYDPSKGAKKETFIHTVVGKKVIDYAAKEAAHADRYKQFPETGPPERIAPAPRRQKLFEMLDALDDEVSRETLLAYVKHNGNASSAAEELKVTEGTVRHRIQVLGPKLARAGFGKEDLSSNRREDKCPQPRKG